MIYISPGRAFHHQASRRPFTSSPKATFMKTAIVCYSHSKNNLILSRELQSRTGATFFLIEETSGRTRLKIFLDLIFNRLPQLKDYPKVHDRYQHHILVSPVWGGRIASPLRSFLVREKENILSYSFVSICGGGGADQERKISDELSSIMGKDPVDVCQLPLTDLLMSEPGKILSYKVQSADMQFYSKMIDTFLSKVNASEQVEAQTEN